MPSHNSYQGFLWRSSVISINRCLCMQSKTGFRYCAQWSLCKNREREREVQEMQQFKVGYICAGGIYIIPTPRLLWCIESRLLAYWVFFCASKQGKWHRKRTQQFIPWSCLGHSVEVTSISSPRTASSYAYASPCNLTAVEITSL